MASSSSNPFSVRIQAGAPAPALPEWVPPAGYFADVPMSNDPEDVSPLIYLGDNSAMNNPFALWGGSAILRDYSPLGAQVYYAGGHETSKFVPNVQFALICDFSTLTWSTANVPLVPNLVNSFVNGLAPDGTSYCPHSYLGLQEVPAAWGGGRKGSLLSFFWAGSSYDNRVNLLDVSLPNNGYSQLAGGAGPLNLLFNAKGNGGNYPISVIDPVRQGWWVTVNGNVDYLIFLHRTGVATQYSALGGNLQNGSMVLCNSLNLLIVIDGGYSSGGYAGTTYRNLYIRNLATGEVTRSHTLGTVPSLTDGYDGASMNYHRPDVLGLQWVDELGCVVGLDQSTVPPSIVKLVPPASDPANGAWTWTTVTSLQHWPQDASGQATLQAAQNNLWSKFRWVPTLRAFVYGTAKNRKPQVVKLS